MKSIAVIGCGVWGSQHVRVLREMRALQWAYDEDSTRLVDIPERTSSIDKIMDDPAVEGVVIATPPDTHAILALHALEAGKHVLIEKPMCGTLDEAEMLIEHPLADRIMVGHLMRYHGGFMRLLDRLPEAGVIEYAYSHRLQPGRVRTDSSSLWQLGPHDIDMLIAVARTPTALTCTRGVARGPVADIVTATFEFSGCIRGHMFISWLHPAKQREFMVIGDRGALVMDQESADEPLAMELANFLAVIDGAVPVVSATHGYEVIRVLDACQRSMDQGGIRICL